MAQAKGHCQRVRILEHTVTNKTSVRSAFTLIELLVVMAIIATLAGILLPALAGARRTAKSTVGVVNQRSMSQIMEMYVQDYSGAYLYPWRIVVQSPDDCNSCTQFTLAIDPAINSDGRAGAGAWRFDEAEPKFNTEQFAHFALSYLSSYRSTNRNAEELYSPGDPDLSRYSVKSAGPGNPNTLYPSSFLMSPTFWLNENRYNAGDRAAVCCSHLKNQRVEGVAFPSAKVLLWQRGDFTQMQHPKLDNNGTTKFMPGPPSWINTRSVIPVALADWSCTEVRMSDLISRAAATNANAMDVLPVGEARPTICAPGPVSGMNNNGKLTGEAAAADEAGPAFFWATRFGIRGRDLPY